MKQMQKDFDICPAYAGMILEGFSSPLSHLHLSRVCGDDPASQISRSILHKFVPRMRG